ncbi:hypothetical protein J8273_3153 [Carpediemonas membranifera]|uniref:Uncharacterized protein n=1 Tax=Carpediemonas membranifera TaxID=201153 RepID=A0A8J6AXG9_9EUKA|nr:hypothetical protein J8273_8993 [Carpediemonas membranifera]KAG9393049.1 hypothetical protein J8273_3177 [Carpediemonas membranifera]KAG9395571.1 hypothetical protein J8273_3153 [Carpediemonas membranifera]|eukprot:KAG9389689.1 hypothetical protein J8273_8993 [Carpediemonas membranifera]
MDINAVVSMLHLVLPQFMDEMDVFTGKHSSSEHLRYLMTMLAAVDVLRGSSQSIRGERHGRAYSKTIHTEFLRSFLLLEREVLNEDPEALEKMDALYSGDREETMKIVEVHDGEEDEPPVTSASSSHKTKKAHKRRLLSARKTQKLTFPSEIVHPDDAALPVERSAFLQKYLKTIKARLPSLERSVERVNRLGDMQTSLASLNHIADSLSEENLTVMRIYVAYNLTLYDYIAKDKFTVDPIIAPTAELTKMAEKQRSEFISRNQSYCTTRTRRTNKSSFYNDVQKHATNMGVKSIERSHIIIGMMLLTYADFGKFLEAGLIPRDTGDARELANMVLESFFMAYNSEGGTRAALMQELKDGVTDTDRLSMMEQMFALSVETNSLTYVKPSPETECEERSGSGKRKGNVTESGDDDGKRAQLE